MKIKEIEHKLFLGNNLSLKIFNEIKSINSVGDYLLKNERCFEIDDTYFDTRKLILAKNNSYLRFRNKNDESRVTLRLMKEEREKEVIIDEITHPLDLVGLRIVLQKLTNESIIDMGDFTTPDLMITLQKAGLIEVISIHNERTEKEIWIEDLKIGRIKYDYFFYRPLEQAKFSEIETDIYKKIFTDGIRRFRKELKEKISCSVTESDVSKYQMGIKNKLFSNKIFYEF